MTTTVREAFRDQARACRDLGSPMTADICDLLADALQDGPVADRMLDWPGDPSSRGHSVPLRLCGALHALVLTGRDAALADAYAARRVDADLLLAAIDGHRDFVLDWLDSPPQTNEVARSAALIGAARFLSGHCDMPLSLLELGTSAGLNLNFDRYHLFEGDGVVLTPEWRGDVPQGSFAVADRRGVDLNPLSAEHDGLRLMAYCWADQDARLERLRAALALARTHPPMVEAGDAGAWLRDRLALPEPGRLRLVFHTVAAQYFPPQTLDMVADTLARSPADAASPLAHFGMEADGGHGAALSLTLRDGDTRRWSLGRADFHGRWIEWAPRPLA
ncbi:DUF2332 family protein [Paracoccus sp. 1_MG-2023]|uniref:DUF2332 domain-containing protein n=1 Tax=unclassified Paracoccus (in: a-proteobacteria) TaxID=2688777 RepID=UPI001C094BA2|nr:DUF2332 family protein [Paracoccus sp. 1_MG-2023]MBU2956618.1 DUF2332 family protein [Paracoccus sp. C2R09]MDO6668724.1 DUF2332 family protein [Paracoccus sp. 1_MG-2023]